MTWTLDLFNKSLYLEHLEDGGFLYEQRLSLIDDPELTWIEVGEWEARLEAHLDALMIGRAKALDICREQAAAGDAGEMHVAVRIFCRHRNQELIEEVLDQLDLEDPESFEAVWRAVADEMPQEWSDWILNHLEGEDPVRVAFAAKVSGYRRLGGGEKILSHLRAEPESLAAQYCLWALGRLLEPKASWAITERSKTEADPKLAEECFSVLARLNEKEIEEKLPQLKIEEGQHNLWRAWLGGRDQISILHSHASREEEPSQEAVLALGLLGDVSVIEYLIDGALTHEDLASKAALALEAISGARLTEEIWIPDEDEEATPSDEEEGQQRGELIVRPSQDPQRWKQWWEDHRDEMKPTRRFRGGRQVTPMTLVEDLLSESTPHEIREACSVELIVRYGCPYAFERDYPVPTQIQCITQLKRWAEKEGSRFEEGRWYVGGELSKS